MLRPRSDFIATFIVLAVLALAVLAAVGSIVYCELGRPAPTIDGIAR
jgi:hypothetical protein